MMESFLEKSRCCANEGDRASMYSAFENAHEIANQLGITITIPTLNVQKEQEYLRGKLDKYLIKASECANDGDNDRMGYYINESKKIAESLNIDIGHRIPTLNSENVPVYLRHLLEETLKHAMESAHQGDEKNMEFDQWSAKRIAAELDIDISKRVDEIAITFHRKFGITARL